MLRPLVFGICCLKIPPRIKNKHAGGVFLPVFRLSASLARHIALLLFLLTSLSLGAFAKAQAAEVKESKVHVDIPSQRLDAALNTVAIKFGKAIIFSSKKVKNKRSPTLQGSYRFEDAVALILEGSGLSMKLNRHGVFVISDEIKAPKVVPKIDRQDEVYDGNIMEEVLVSSRKREEMLQDVPLHIQALQVETLNQSQITRIEEITNLSPTVSFSVRRGFDQTSVRIRGIGTQELGSGVEPSVATVVDGVVMARGGTMFNELPDIERVEVLNGPQGTLFGKNASAGLISIVTKQPNTQAFETNLSLRATSDQDYGGKYSFSGPLNDDVAFRASGFWRSFGGNVKNIVTSDDVNGVDAYGWRGKLSYQYSDSTDLLFSADFSRQVTECCARIHREERISPAVTAGREGTPDIDSSFINYRGENITGGKLAGSAAEVLGPNINIGLENTKIAQNFDPFQESINTGLSVELNHTFSNELTLTSLTAYREWEASSGWDNDLTAFPFQERQTSDRDADWVSQEIRLSSPTGERFDYLLGLYFYTAKTNATEISDRVTIDTGQEQLFKIRATSGFDNVATFAHVNYRFTDEITTFAGFRLLNDTAWARAQWEQCHGRNARTDVPDYDCTTPVVSGRKSDTKLIYQLGLQYALTENINAYSSYSTGYKGRGFSLEYGFDADRLASGKEPIKGEELNSIELGIKGMLGESTRFNLVYYDTVVDGLQQSLRDLNTIANVLGSIDETKTRGLEFSFDTYVNDSIELGISYGYNDAYYSDFKNANCYLGQTEEEGCIENVQDRSGDKLEASPQNKVVLSGRYESKRDGIRPFTQFNYRWQSETLMSSNGDPSTEQEAFGILDLSLGLLSRNQRYSLSFFVKNAFDKYYIQGADVNGPDMGGVVLHYLPRDFERHVGISFNYAL